MKNDFWADEDNDDDEALNAIAAHVEASRFVASRPVGLVVSSYGGVFHYRWSFLDTDNREMLLGLMDDLTRLREPNAISNILNNPLWVLPYAETPSLYVIPGPHRVERVVGVEIKYACDCERDV
jgi:hypothetical protein